MKALNASCVNLLSAGQVITCVLDALKELIENSLDSGAKTIKIKIEDLGLQKITVTDDGSGITKNGRETCALAHTTSKISSFEELSDDLSTFGFRGEALHALCATSDVMITTRCRDEEYGQKITFDHNGNPIRTENVAAQYGTTVTVSKLLSQFPVRIREERANFSVDNMRNLFARYFLASPTVRFVIDAPPHLTMTRPPLTSLSQAVSLEYGKQVAAALCEKAADGESGDIQIRVRGMIPSPTCDWKNASTSRLQTKQLILVNGRPVRNSQIEKKINELCWKRFGTVPRRMPRFVLCIDFFRYSQICSSMVDVNVDPLKSHVIFADLTVVSRLIDKVVSFEEEVVRFKNIKEWPSRKISISKPDVNIEELGAGCVWKEAGVMDSTSLFSVTDVRGCTHLVSVVMEELFEKIGVPMAELGRTSHAELIVNYWEQIMGLHNEEPRVFHLLQL